MKTYVEKISASWSQFDFEMKGKEETIDYLYSGIGYFISDTKNKVDVSKLTFYLQFDKDSSTIFKPFLVKDDENAKEVAKELYDIISKSKDFNKATGIKMKYYVDEDGEISFPTLEIEYNPEIMKSILVNRTIDSDAITAAQICACYDRGEYMGD